MKFSDDKYLKTAFLIGGIYDILLGIPLLIMPVGVTELFGVSPPTDIIFVQVAALFLIGVGYSLLYAIHDVQKMAFVGYASSFVRLSYTVIVVLGIFNQTVENGYLLTAITDFITAIILLVPLLLTEDVGYSRIWKID
jgi:hypothetical protein